MATARYDFIAEGRLRTAMAELDPELLGAMAAIGRLTRSQMSASSLNGPVFSINSWRRQRGKLGLTPEPACTI
jgi:hypothetical protein